MRWTHVILSLVLLATGILSAPLVTDCPKGCFCSWSASKLLDAKCSSLTFLKKKLPPEKASAVTSLRISDIAHGSLEPLGQFANLKSLALPSNGLKTIPVADLPPSIRHVDLSNNSITFLPEELISLSNLKSLNLEANPISCTCITLAVVDALLKKGVSLGTRTQCHSPPINRGKLVHLAACSQTHHRAKIIDEVMLGDAPYEAEEGSGVIVEPVDTDRQHWVSSIEEEFLTSDENKITTSKVPLGKTPTNEEIHTGEAPVDRAPFEDELTIDLTHTEESPVEKSSSKEEHIIHETHGEKFPVEAAPSEEIDGSGEAEILPTHVFPNEKLPDDADSSSTTENEDDYDIGDWDSESPSSVEEDSVTGAPPIKACFFECSTSAPLANSSEDGTDDESSGPGVLEEVKMLFHDIIGSPEIEAPVVPPSTDAPLTLASEFVTVPVSSINETTPSAPKEPNETAKVVGLAEAKQSNNDEDESGSYSTYIFLAVLLLLVVVLVGYALWQKHNIRKRAREPPKKPEITPEEMQLLDRLVTETAKPNGHHAFSDGNLPMNGGGGHKDHHHHHHHRRPIVVSSTTDDSDFTVSPEIESPVEMPSDTALPEEESLLPPETKRVTIKASELPDSTPKTPLLVTRHLDSDGSIVSTPSTSGQKVHITK